MNEQTIYARRWWTLGILSLSVIILAIDNSILNVALPTLVRELSASASQLQWIVDSYILVFAGLLLTVGSLGDRFGRRLMLQVGMGLFGLASVVAAFATSADQLIFLRAMMGIGGSMIMPSTLSILMHVFPAKERVKALGVWSMMIGLGVPLGPVIGGWLIDNYWWGSVFLINLPIVAIAIIGGIFLIPESKNPVRRKLDPIGALLVLVGMVSLLYGIIEAPLKGWTSSTTLIFGGLGIAILTAFIFWELHTPEPMLNVRLFKNPRFSAASFSVTTLFFMMAGTMFFLMQHLQFVMDYGALDAGVATLPLVAGIMVAAPIGTKLVGRVGPKRLVASGLVIIAGGLALISLVTLESEFPLIGAALLTFGLGMGVMMAPATDSILGTIPQEQSGVGSAVNETMQQLGGALGIALLGSLLSTSYGNKIAPLLVGVPEPIASMARDSLGATIQIGKMGGEQGQMLIAAAKGAFVEAMQSTVLLTAGLALVASLVVLTFLPARHVSEQPVEVESVEQEPGFEF